MKYFALTLIFALLSASAFSQKMTDLDKLVATERAFAKAAAETSTKEAFLKFLADDAIVFEPTAVNGKEVWNKRPPSVGLLSWEPVWADISADGTIGYTTGPWEFRPKGKDGEPVAFGQYVTIWKKQENGEFKAVLDIGISHGKHEGPAGELGFPEDAGEKATRGNKSPVGPRPSNVQFAADGRLYRDGSFVMAGEEAFEKIRSEAWHFESPVVCNSTISFEYCYGTALVNDKRGNFLSIRKDRNGKWEGVIGLYSQLPE